MKNYSIIIFLFIATVCGNAQNKVGYNYDNNGNRYQRYFVGMRPAGNDSTAKDSLASAPSADVITEAKELAEQKGITVYPNPTKDLIFVSITKDHEKHSKNAEMYLVDNVGKLIDRKKYKGSEISFDLSRNPPGTYFLKILFDDQTKLNYNIIKVD